MKYNMQDSVDIFVPRRSTTLLLKRIGALVTKPYYTILDFTNISIGVGIVFDFSGDEQHRLSFDVFPDVFNNTRVRSLLMILYYLCVVHCTRVYLHDIVPPLPAAAANSCHALA